MSILNQYLQVEISYRCEGERGKDIEWLKRSTGKWRIKNNEL